MKKVLIITYYWPPSGGSGVQRWLKFAKYLPQSGWEPVIYTPLNPEANTMDAALLKDVSPHTTVIKRKILEPYGIYKTLLGKEKDKPIKANIIAGQDNGSFLHRVSMFIRGNVFIPDPRCLWINPSVRFLKKYLKEHPVDAIVSTGPPHSMHLIAEKVSKATGISWIADFRDPWTEIFYFKHLHLSKYAYNRHRKLEQKVLENANAVVVVSRKMQEDFARRTAKPVEVITNGFDPDDFPAVEAVPETKNGLLEQEKQPDSKFLLIHTGILVDNGNPNLLWEILGEKAAAEPSFKANLEIRTMGQVDPSILKDIQNNNLEAHFVNMGYVPHNEATQWQQKASLLLLPLRKEPEAAAILTGKFFEYLAAGKPILAFGPVEGDLAVALKESESGIICEWNDKTAIKTAVDKAYAQYLKGDVLPLETLPDAALKYSRKTLTDKLSALLNNIKK